MKRLSLLLLIYSFPCLSGGSALAADRFRAATDQLSDVREVRARKLVRRYSDRVLTVVLSNGELKVGRPRALHQGRLVLDQINSADTVQVHIRDVDRVILRPGTTEVLLPAVTAIGVGALAAGVLALTGSVDATGVIAVGGVGQLPALGWDGETSGQRPS